MQPSLSTVHALELGLCVSDHGRHCRASTCDVQAPFLGDLPLAEGLRVATLLADACPNIRTLSIGEVGVAVLDAIAARCPHLTRLNLSCDNDPSDRRFSPSGSFLTRPSSHSSFDAKLADQAFRQQLAYVQAMASFPHVTILDMGALGSCEQASVWLLLPVGLEELHCRDLPWELPLGLNLPKLQQIHLVHSLQHARHSPQQHYAAICQLARLLTAAPRLSTLSSTPAAFASPSSSSSSFLSSSFSSSRSVSTYSSPTSSASGSGVFGAACATATAVASVPAPSVPDGRTSSQASSRVAFATDRRRGVSAAPCNAPATATAAMPTFRLNIASCMSGEVDAIGMLHARLAAGLALGPVQIQCGAAFNFELWGPGMLSLGDVLCRLQPMPHFSSCQLLVAYDEDPTGCLAHIARVS